MKIIQDVGRQQVTVEYDFADHVKGYEPLDLPKPGIAHLLNVKLESVREMARAMGFELANMTTLNDLGHSFHDEGRVDEAEGVHRAIALIRKEGA